MEPKHLEDKTEHIDALSDAVAELDQQIQRSLENRQHDMIDHLDDYFDTVETRLTSLRNFCKSLRKPSTDGNPPT